MSLGSPSLMRNQKKFVALCSSFLSDPFFSLFHRPIGSLVRYLSNLLLKKRFLLKDQLKLQRLFKVRLLMIKDFFQSTFIYFFFKTKTRPNLQKKFSL